MDRLGHERKTLDLVDNRVAELPLLRCHQFDGSRIAEAVLGRQRSRPCTYSRIPVGSRNTHLDPDCYGSPIQSVELQGEPLDEHHGRYIDDYRTILDVGYWGASTLLPLPQHYRNHVYGTHRRVCLEVACACRCRSTESRGRRSPG